jgi:hypothetical protein
MINILSDIGHSFYIEKTCESSPMLFYWFLLVLYFHEFHDKKTDPPNVKKGQRQNQINPRGEVIYVHNLFCIIDAGTPL